MSQATRTMLGLTLLAVPTLVYGGLTILGVLSSGAFGMPAPQNLTPIQQALYRAGHAHAGVLVLLSLILQIALDHVGLGSRTVWTLRIAALVAAILVSGGFFGLAHAAVMRFLLYAGVTCVVLTTIITGVGLLRAR